MIIMIIWFRSLPQQKLDQTEWRPFIENRWFFTHYMKFVYLLMAGFILLPYIAGYISNYSIRVNPIYVLLIIPVFIVHEIIHILVIYSKGDISLTFKGMHFWLNTNATMSKARFWVFMSLPYLLLSVVPGTAAWLVSGSIRSVLLYVSWLNLILSGSDIVNSFLIAIKPGKSVFCNGYYRIAK